MYNIVTTANNTVLHSKVANRVDLSSQEKSCNKDSTEVYCYYSFFVLVTIFMTLIVSIYQKN